MTHSGAAALLHSADLCREPEGRALRNRAGGPADGRRVSRWGWVERQRVSLVVWASLPEGWSLKAGDWLFQASSLCTTPRWIKQEDVPRKSSLARHPPGRQPPPRGGVGETLVRQHPRAPTHPQAHLRAPPGSGHPRGQKLGQGHPSVHTALEKSFHTDSVPVCEGGQRLRPRRPSPLVLWNPPSQLPCPSVPSKW